MIKAVFLIGNAKEILNLWSGKTKKGKRTLKSSCIKVNNSVVFEGEVGKTKFIFIALDKKKTNKITEIIDRLGISSRESVAVITEKESEVAEEMGFEKVSKKRYYFGSGSCGILVALRGSIKNKDINEIASVLFLNFNDEIYREDGRLKGIIK